MNCHEARELCSALVDDALTADERTALDAHLEGCAECRRELDRLRQTVALLASTAPVRAPVGFVDRVLTAARPEPWHRRALRALSLPFRVRLPLEAAALLLVGGLAVYVFQHSPELQQAARNDRPTAAKSSAEAPRDPRSALDKSPEDARTSAPYAPAQARESGPTSGRAERRLEPAVPKPAVSTAPPAAAPATPPAPAAPAQQPSPGVGAKESQVSGSAGRAAEVGPGATGEVGRTSNAQATEDDRRRLASGPGEREQKKARADEARSAKSDGTQATSPPPAAPPVGEGARKAAPPAAAPAATAPPAVPMADAPPPASSRDESAAPPLARPKAAEPALRSRQEIAASSRPAPQGGAHVAAVLSATDREAALRGLADLVARAQGRELARRSEADGIVVDVLIPRAAYVEFAQGLGRLGQVAMPLQAAGFPEEVRVSVRVRP